jgi:hypothetical protein
MENVAWTQQLSRRISREQDADSKREKLIWASYQGEVDSMLRGLSLQMEKLRRFRKMEKLACLSYMGRVDFMRAVLPTNGKTILGSIGCLSKVSES